MKKKILFASFPADGHFNPLTGLAVHLANTGYDVRWYTSVSYAAKLQKLQIPHYPFKKALDAADGDFVKLYPGREKHRSQIAKLKFDITNVFILRGPEYFEDIKNIYDEFPFELMIADVAFTGIPFVKELLHIPVISIGVFPLTETSKDLAPTGLGVTPDYSFFGKIKMALLRTFARQVIFKQPNKVMYTLCEKYNIPHNRESLFDMLVQKSDLLLQSGTPGFEYYRSDLSHHVRFVGALLPHSSSSARPVKWYDDRLKRYSKVILVTQGTVEKDSEKILVPTLEAYKNTDTLVIATTGGSQTGELRKKYGQENIIIEDFIPFADIMPYANVYITNGGYGGVMLGIQNKLPMVVAGVHEGKNEICARIGYFKLGVNLKKEKPAPAEIKKAADTILADGMYKKNIERLSREFAEYQPMELGAKYVSQLLKTGVITIESKKKKTA